VSVDRSFIRTPLTGTVTATSITGLDFAGVTSTSVEQAAMVLGQGDDTLTLDIAAGGPTATVSGGTGNDEVIVESIAEATNFVGGMGFDTLTVPIAGASAALNLLDNLQFTVENLHVDNHTSTVSTGWKVEGE